MIKYDTEWRPMPKIKGYKASRDGRILKLAYEIRLPSGHARKKQERIVKQSKTSDGKMVVSVHGRTKLVHRLIASAWLGSARYKSIECIDGDYANCAVDNLKYVSRTKTSIKPYQNGFSRGTNGLTTDKVHGIRAKIRGGYTSVEVARFYGVSEATISRVINKSRWWYIKDNGAIEYKVEPTASDVIVTDDANVNGDWDAEEIWVDIKGHEDRYQISSWGNVRSLDRVTITSHGQHRNYNIWD